MPHDDDSFLARVLAEMAVAPADGEFYQLTLTSPDGQHIEIGKQTHWVGDEVVNGQPFEVREASIVDPHTMLDLYKAIREPALVVSDGREFTLFVALGGHGIVERSLVEAQFPEILGPKIAVPAGQFGFKTLAGIDPASFKRAPTPKQRMRVLNRDGRRCKICGRRPDDVDDLQLRVHHVRPWAQGGLTEDKNLITLCHTCHDGLDPHFDWSLFAYVDPMPTSGATDEYAGGVGRYRELLARVTAQERLSNAGVD